MAVDVCSEIVIDRPRRVVAAFAADPENATKWYENVKAVRCESPLPLVVGARITFDAAFLNRRLTYTYEVRELVGDELLVMSTVEGPFPMETTYRWDELSPGTTKMTLRNRGEPSGFAAVTAPVICLLYTSDAADE